MTHRVEELMIQARAALSEAALRTGDFDGVEAMLSEALRLAEADGDLGSQAGALDQTGLVLHFRTLELPREQWRTVDSGPELELFERALAIRRQIGDATQVAESLFHVGLVHQVLRGDWDASLPLFREALSLVEPDGDAHLRGELHRHLGFHVLLKDGRPGEALPYFETSLELWRTLERSGWVVAGLVALARCETRAGRHGEAAGHSREALELARQEGLRQRYVTSAEEANRLAEAAAAERA
jgi:tetratricopeptide (TPR) repeat protein